jgi:hypothetical protein
VVEAASGDVGERTGQEIVAKTQTTRHPLRREAGVSL